MDCRTAKCYSHDRDSYPCPQGHLSQALINWGTSPPLLAKTAAASIRVATCNSISRTFQSFQQFTNRQPNIQSNTVLKHSLAEYYYSIFSGEFLPAEAKLCNRKIAAWNFRDDINKMNGKMVELGWPVYLTWLPEMCWSMSLHAAHVITLPDENSPYAAEFAMIIYIEPHYSISINVLLL